MTLLSAASTSPRCSSSRKPTPSPPSLHLGTYSHSTSDAIAIALDNVTNGLVVYPEVIRSHLDQELPFIATENIIMKMVERGASRQDAHEEIRVLSHQAAAVVKGEGKPNDLIQRIKNTEYFKPVHADLDEMLDPKLYVGRSGVIVERFCADVAKKLEKYKEYLDKAQTAELSI